jgi:ribosome-associated heat shock protein Hsp15
MAEAMRLDKFLWFARIVKTRSLAQKLAEDGRLRLTGRVIDRAHAPVKIGDVLSFAVHGRIRVLRVEALPARRGPPAEARALYTDLAPSRDGEGNQPQAGGGGSETERAQAVPAPPSSPVDDPSHRGLGLAPSRRAP